MKIAIFTLVALLTQGALAINFSCVTGYPTTSFIGQTPKDSDTFSVELINHNGVELMPISSGILTSNDLTVIRQRSRDLKNVGDRAQFTFPLANCKTYQDGTFYCFDGSKFKGTDGNEISVYSMSISLITTRLLDHVIEETQANVQFKIGDKNHDVTMRYGQEECSIRLK